MAKRIRVGGGSRRRRHASRRYFRHQNSHTEQLSWNQGCIHGYFTRSTNMNSSLISFTIRYNRHVNDSELHVFVTRMIETGLSNSPAQIDLPGDANRSSNTSYYSASLESEASPPTGGCRRRSVTGTLKSKCASNKKPASPLTLTTASEDEETESSSLVEENYPQKFNLLGSVDIADSDVHVGDQIIYEGSGSGDGTDRCCQQPIVRQNGRVKFNLPGNFNISNSTVQFGDRVTVIQKEAAEHKENPPPNYGWLGFVLNAFLVPISLQQFAVFIIALCFLKNSGWKP